jgi:hypothetical protein
MKRIAFFFSMMIVLTLTSAVKDPADMERVLISNNFLGEE